VTPGAHVLVLVILVALVLFGVACELWQTHRERIDSAEDERARHARLMREIDRHTTEQEPRQ
jgi:hypothetical protein